MKKFRIYEFHPQIYPRRLWVAKGGTFEDIKTRFAAYNGEELGEPSDAIAVTYIVQTRDDNRYLGHLIWFPSAKDMTSSIMAHEAFHASMDLFGMIGCKMHYDNQEPFAYLVGWVVDCIDKVKRNKAE